MAKAKTYTFVVRGRLAFPVDMLRYDACWPESSGDANELEESVVRNDPIKVREICLVSFREPTKERWRSFSWTVVSVDAR